LTQVHDPQFFLAIDLAIRRVVRVFAVTLESFNALLRAAPPPFSQSRSRDAAPTANDPCVAELLIEIDPAKALFNFVIHASIKA
jgi:hypothetical protein